MVDLGLGQRQKRDGRVGCHARGVADDGDGVEVAAPVVGVVAEDGDGGVTAAALLLELAHDARAGHAGAVDHRRDAPAVASHERALDAPPRHRHEHDRQQRRCTQRQPARNRPAVRVGVDQEQPHHREREHARQHQHHAPDLLDGADPPPRQQAGRKRRDEVERDHHPREPQHVAGFADDRLPHHASRQQRRRQTEGLGARQGHPVGKLAADLGARPRLRQGPMARERVLRSVKDGFHEWVR